MSHSLEARLREKIARLRARGLVPILIGYGRKSFIHGREDALSTQYQKSVCETYAQTLGCAFEWFADDKRGWQSGRDEKNRPDWRRLKTQLLLDDAGQPVRPEIIGVCCENTRAVFRNVKLILDWIDSLPARDLEFIDLSNPTLDVRTNEGRGYLIMKANFDEQESLRASSRLKNHVAYRFQEGLHWGKPMLGTKSVGRGPDHRLVADEELGVWHLKTKSIQGKRSEPPPGARPEQFRGYLDAVRAWYERYTSADISLPRGADELNALGYRSKGNHGKPALFHAEYLWRLTNQWRKYAGQVTQGRSHRLTRATRAKHEPILPLELLARVEAKLKQRQNRRMNGPRFKHPPVLLWKIALCADCNKPYWSSHPNGWASYHHYHPECSTRGYISAKRLDAEALAYVLEHLTLTDAQMERILRRAQALQKPKPAKHVTVATDELSQRLANLDRSLRAAKLSDTLRQQMLAQAQREFTPSPILIQESPTASIVPTADAVRTRVREYRNTLERIASIDPAATNAILRDLFESVIIDGKTKTILKYNAHAWCKMFFD